MSFENIPEPPDLMRRHIQTPHRVHLRFGTISVALESNSAELLESIASNADAGPPSDERVVRCRLIVDVDAVAPPEPPRRIRTNELTVVTCGCAVVIAADRGMREVIGFVGTRATQALAEAQVVPILRSLFSEFSDSAMD